MSIVNWVALSTLTIFVSEANVPAPASARSFSTTNPTLYPVVEPTVIWVAVDANVAVWPSTLSHLPSGNELRENIWPPSVALFKLKLYSLPTNKSNVGTNWSTPLPVSIVNLKSSATVCTPYAVVPAASLTKYPPALKPK